MIGLGVKVQGYDIRQEQDTFEVVITHGHEEVYRETLERRLSFSELNQLLFEKVGRRKIHGLRK